MRKTAKVVMGLTCGCVVFAAAAARAIEPDKAENRVEFEVKVHSPWLAKMPFLKQVFAQVAEEHACQQKACEQKFEFKSGPCPMAVDFAFPPAHGPLVLFSHAAAPPPGVCQVCPPPAAACAAACTAARCCAENACSARSANCDCDDCQCCKGCSGSSHARHDHDSLIEHILEI